MLLIFNILQIVNLYSMIVEINTIKAIILTIATIITIITTSYGKKSVIFVVRKIVTKTCILIMSNKNRNSFRDKTES